MLASGPTLHRKPYRLSDTLRFLLSVCLCVRDGCGRGCNEFAVRVQNHHVASVSRLSPLKFLIGRQEKMKTRKEEESLGNNLTGNPMKKLDVGEL